MRELNASAPRSSLWRRAWNGGLAAKRWAWLAQAGAIAVLATLWAVADESTATLMRMLYQAHEAGHVDEAEALRFAQLALLHGSAAANATSGKRGLGRREISSTELPSRRQRPVCAPVLLGAFHPHGQLVKRR